MKHRYTWICKNNHEFVLGAHHVKNGHWCPKCNRSNLEDAVNNFFIKIHYNDYIAQYRFPDCKNKKPLPFDFYLPSLNICIEADGEQHFSDRMKGYFAGTLKSIQHRDSIKTNYCLQKGIKLIRIPYWDFNNIELILTKELNLIAAPK